MSNEDVYTYVKIDEYGYSIFKNGKDTGAIVTAFCSGCEPIRFGSDPQPNQMAHYDGCMSEDYYDDGRYYLSIGEEEVEE